MTDGRKKMFPIRLRDDDRENLETVKRTFNLKTLADAFRFAVRVTKFLASIDDETTQMLKDAHKNYEDENPGCWAVTVKNPATVEKEFDGDGVKKPIGLLDKEGNFRS